MSHRFGATAYGLRPSAKAVNDWRESALCRDEDPELFYPIGESGPAILQIEQAKAVCYRCPVIEECLEWALGSGEEHGVCGGASESERRALRRERGIMAAVEPEPVPQVCANGHLLTKANIYRRPNGSRECRDCRNSSYAPKHREKRAAAR